MVNFDTMRLETPEEEKRRLAGERVAENSVASDPAQIAVEAATVQEEQRQLQGDAARQAGEDEAAAAQLAEQIKSGNLGMGVRPEEVVQEKPNKDIVEMIGAPQTGTFEKYGAGMRRSAEELVTIKQQMKDKWKELVAQGGAEKRPDLMGEHEALNAQRNRLLSDVEGKSGELRETAMMDPQIIINLATAGEMGTGYRPGEGIGKIDRMLRGNPEFMMKVLDALSRDDAESFSAHTYGVTPQHREVYIAAVKKNHLNYQFGAKEWKTDPEVQQIALKSGLDPAYLEK